MSKYKTACVFGGTGFIGRQVVRELAQRGVRIKVATRVPESAYFLKPCGVVGQVVPFACDYKNPESLVDAVKGCDYVVNCVGILYEKRRGDFTKVHTDLAGAIAKACAQENVERFVHISSLGADQSAAKYAISKKKGEEEILSEYPNAVILRPSVVFGEDDDFFNQFARMAEVLPFLPLIGGGHTKFQPVYVGDVADAVMVGLENENIQGVYQLGGPDVVNFKEIYEILFSYTQNSVRLVKLPFALAKIQALFLSLLPKPLLTRDQVQILKSDNIVEDDASGFEALGLKPTAMQTILPKYLSRYIPGGRFAHLKKA